VLSVGKLGRVSVVVLQIAIACQCVALGWMHLFGATPINSFLIGSGVGMEPTQAVDYIAGFGLVLLGGMVLARPVYWVLSVIALWFLLNAVTSWLNYATDANALLYQVAPAAQAVRWLAPVALILLVAGRARSAMWVLLIASCATFIGHGIKDVLHYKDYLEIIDNTFTNYTDIKWPEEKTRAVLRAIGIADIICASLLLLTRWRWLALPMAVWGGVAAVSRVTANGAGDWPEVLLRVCNAAAPFVVFLLLCAIHSKRHTSAADPAAHWDFTPSGDAQRETFPVAAPTPAPAPAPTPTPAPAPAPAPTPEPRSKPDARSSSPAISSPASSQEPSSSPPKRPPPRDIYE